MRAPLQGTRTKKGTWRIVVMVTDAHGCQIR